MDAVLPPKRLLAVPVLPNKLVVEVGAAVEVFPNENAMLGHLVHGKSILQDS